jgi:hypothetical protein
MGKRRIPTTSGDGHVGWWVNAGLGVLERDPRTPFEVGGERGAELGVGGKPDVVGAAGE